jgi:hypothetical protein
LPHAEHHATGESGNNLLPTPRTLSPPLPPSPPTTTSFISPESPGFASNNSSSSKSQKTHAQHPTPSLPHKSSLKVRAQIDLLACTLFNLTFTAWFFDLNPPIAASSMLKLPFTPHSMPPRPPAYFPILKIFSKSSLPAQGTSARRRHRQFHQAASKFPLPRALHLRQPQ